ncbi:hypothetical protein ACT3TP_02385 [Glutamicibacter sp. AOP38-B1-38]|uniref:hypothetical protein n=1 Tax=Glutamicibacter sp. AOP38-B1-38 TaxID=3457680 RepID=UPI0040346BB3
MTNHKPGEVDKAIRPSRHGNQADFQSNNEYFRCHLWPEPSKLTSIAAVRAAILACHTVVNAQPEDSAVQSFQHQINCFQDDFAAPAGILDAAQGLGHTPVDIYVAKGNALVHIQGLGLRFTACPTKSIFH